MKTVYCCWCGSYCGQYCIKITLLARGFSRRRRNFWIFSEIGVVSEVIQSLGGPGPAVVCASIFPRRRSLARRYGSSPRLALRRRTSEADRTWIFPNRRRVLSDGMITPPGGPVGKIPTGFVMDYLQLVRRSMKLPPACIACIYIYK